MIIEGPRESSTLLYPVSLWYLGVETGYRVGTPYRRRENINDINVRMGGLPPIPAKWSA